MRRGFDQPTSSSASRSSGTDSRKYARRTRRGRNDTPVQTETISARPKSLIQPSLAQPQQPHEIQPASFGRKSPAYLEGKNPYGQFLENTDHPYRRPKVMGSAPSQISATTESRPRASGSFQSKTRPEPKAEPEREVTAPNPLPTLLPQRTPANSVSVRAVKDFFESKASQNRSAPPLPPERASAAAEGEVSRSTMGEKKASFLSRSRFSHRTGGPARVSGPTSQLTIRLESEMGPSMPRPPPDAHSQSELSKRLSPFARPKSDTVAPKAIVRKATTNQDSYMDQDLSSPDSSGQNSTRRKSTNIFETGPRGAQSLGFERQAVDDSLALDKASGAPLIALEHTNKSDDRHASDETIRRHPIQRPVSAAESDEGATEGASTSPTQTRRTKPCCHVRRIFQDDAAFAAKFIRRHKSRSAPMTDEGLLLDRETELRSRGSSVTDIGQPSVSCNVDAPGDIPKRNEDFPSNSFSCDGSSSTPSMSHRSTARVPVPQSAASTSAEDLRATVLYHVDWRAASGTRNTKDFGYPGARIKPLQDPDYWIKRTCGHFSYMANSESTEEACRKLCRQCAIKSSPTLSQPNKQQRTHRRAANSSSLSPSSQSSDKVGDACGRNSRRYQTHSECLPTDNVGETFAKDLGYIIDAILEEHTNTLQGVINDIMDSHPSLAQLRRISRDQVQRCQIGGVCTNTSSTSCRPSCAHEPVCYTTWDRAQQVCE